MKKAAALFLFFTFVSSIGLTPFSVSSSDAIENSWTILAEMPTARYRHAVAEVNGKIYAIGGWASGSVLSTNEEYDPETNTWTTKTPMLTPRYYFAVAVYENKIYTFGGLTGQPSLENNTYVGVTEVYDPATDTWETKTSMPTKRSALSANVANDKIYLIGGIQYSTGIGFYIDSDVNEVYNPKSDSWNSTTAIPISVFNYASAVVDDKIYVMGGSTQDGFENNVYFNANQVYDPITATWTEATPIPTGVRFAGAGATTGKLAPKKIYVIGGSTVHSPEGSNLTQVYDPEWDIWSTGASMPTPRSDLRIAVLNDSLYAIGGFFDTAETFAENERYTPFGYENESKQPEPFPTLLIVAVLLGIVVVIIAILVYLKRPKHETEKPHLQ